MRADIQIKIFFSFSFDSLQFSFPPAFLSISLSFPPLLSPLLPASLSPCIPPFFLNLRGIFWNTVLHLACFTPLHHVMPLWIWEAHIPQLAPCCCQPTWRQCRIIFGEWCYEQVAVVGGILRRLPHNLAAAGVLLVWDQVSDQMAAAVQPFPGQQARTASPGVGRGLCLSHQAPWPALAWKAWPKAGTSYDRIGAVPRPHNGQKWAQGTLELKHLPQVDFGNCLRF